MARRYTVVLAGVVSVSVVAAPAWAQLGTVGKGLKQATKQAKRGAATGAEATKGEAHDVKEAAKPVVLSDAEEMDLGTKVSAMLRKKYGVVQNAAIHRYVTLVGDALAGASTRPRLHWTFIVLDTDGVNAFAAPGGFIHITRGALALMQNESELAGVIGHEITHVTEKHTVNAIEKNKRVQNIAGLTRANVIQEFTRHAYETVFENAYDRGDEKEADRGGVILANSVGYAPGGLGAFLKRLADRNKDRNDRNGLFASHPDTQDRLDDLSKLVSKQKLSASATVSPRYRQSVPYKPVPVAQVAAGVGGTSALGEAKPAQASQKSSGGGKFGLSKLSAITREKPATQTVSSAGSRGVNPDRDAKGGPNSALVPVTVTAADVEQFRKGIA